MGAFAGGTSGVIGDPSYNRSHMILKVDHDGSSFRKEDSGAPPVHKVVVIKKSNIKKFIKMKKKEKQKALQLSQNEEVLKTIKMQENISKLNDFCKKNIQKNAHKKRQGTFPHNQNNLSLK